MPSTFDPLLRTELQATGENLGSWGTKLNSAALSLLSEAIAGMAVIAMPNTDYALGDVDGASSEARRATIVLTGSAMTAQRDLIIPARAKQYAVLNAASQAVRVRCVGGSSSRVIPAGDADVIATNGTTVWSVLAYGLGGQTVTQALADRARIALPNTWSATQEFAASPNNVIVSGAAGTWRSIIGRTGSVNRWLMRLGTDDAETGANAGSNFDIWGGTDAGVWSRALRIVRATNGVEVDQSLTVRAQARLSGGSDTIPALGASTYGLMVNSPLAAGNYGLTMGTIAANGAGWLQAMRTDGVGTAYPLMLNPQGGPVMSGPLFVAATTADVLEVRSTTPISAVNFRNSANTGGFIRYDGAVLRVVTNNVELATFSAGALGIVGRVNTFAGVADALRMHNSAGLAQGYVGVEGIDAGAPANALRLRGDGGIWLSIAGAGVGSFSTTGLRARVQDAPLTGGTLTAACANTQIAASGGITVPSGVFSAGDMVLIAGNGAVRTITQGAGLTLNWAGVAGTRTLASDGIMVVRFRSASVADVAGQGVT